MRKLDNYDIIIHEETQGRRLISGSALEIMRLLFDFKGKIVPLNHKGLNNYSDVGGGIYMEVCSADNHDELLNRVPPLGW
jgi:hypothetical protein